jgi:hypothetical protein
MVSFILGFLAIHKKPRGSERWYSLLGAFAGQFQKVTISFVMSVRQHGTTRFPPDESASKLTLRMCTNIWQQPNFG